MVESIWSFLIFLLVFFDNKHFIYNVVNHLTPNSDLTSSLLITALNQINYIPINMLWFFFFCRWTAAILWPCIGFWEREFILLSNQSLYFFPYLELQIEYTCFYFVYLFILSFSFSLNNCWVRWVGGSWPLLWLLLNSYFFYAWNGIDYVCMSILWSSESLDEGIKQPVDGVSNKQVDY